MRTLITGASSGIGAAQTFAEVVDVADESSVRDGVVRCSAQGPLGRVFANAGVSTGEETAFCRRR